MCWEDVNFDPFNFFKIFSINSFLFCFWVVLFQHFFNLNVCMMEGDIPKMGIYTPFLY